MKKRICITICFLTIQICNSQNLIPNADFELGPTLISMGWMHGVFPNCLPYNFVYGPDEWTVTAFTPDRMLEGQIPCNWDDDTAQSGSAFIVLGGTEGGKATLINSLEKDYIYDFGGYIQLETFRGTQPWPCRIQFIFNGGDTLITPFISDSLNWLAYDTTFMASAISTEIEIKGMGGGSGLEVDNLHLEKITPTGIFLNNNIKELPYVFPNPFSDKINFAANDNKWYEVFIFDITSREMLNQNFTNAVSLNTEQLAKGLYFYEVRNKNGLCKKGKIVKE